MKYIIRVSSGEYPDDIDAAVVDVDEDLLKTIGARRRVFNLAKQEDSDIYSMRYWCGAAEFIESKDDVEEYLEGSMLLPDGYAYTAARIAGLTMVITMDGVHWTCYRKHCDKELATSVLGYVVLKDLPGAAVLES